MGWLGWGWEQAARTDVNVIELALEGRSGLLRMIFGDGSPEPRERRAVTAERWQAFKSSHNRRYAEKGKGSSRRRGS